MARFIHSILTAQANVTADGVESFDLPVNPLSVVLIHLAPLNESGTITTFGLVQRLLQAITTLTILHKGAQVISASGPDLFAYAALFHGISIAQSNPVNTDDDRRSLVLPIVLGRRAYDPQECFPESRRGELQLQIDWDIANTGYDGLNISIETIELPDATPSVVQKITTLSQTFGATGDNDIDLPIGNAIRALLCFGTTGFAGATPAPTLGELSVMMDNIQVGYSSTDFEVSRAIANLSRPMTPWDEHLHSVNVAASTETDSRPNDAIFPLMELYTLLDFDPTADDMYSLQTEGAGRVNVRVNAEAANAARILPIERIDAASFA